MFLERQTYYIHQGRGDCRLCVHLVIRLVATDGVIRLVATDGMIMCGYFSLTGLIMVTFSISDMTFVVPNYMEIGCNL